MSFDDAQALTNQVLIAMPGMTDPRFEGTVTLICEHSAEGALGVIVNRPTDLSFGAVLRELDLVPGSDEVDSARVLYGGPVAQDRGFVLHRLGGDFDATLDIGDGVRISFSLDIVSEIATGKAPDAALFGLGYAGWSAGQLEEEMLSNAWLTAPSAHDLVFECPFEQRWRKAAESIGVDISRLSSGAGHG